MFSGAGILDVTASPGLREIRIRIFPPPDCVAAGILAQDNIKVTVPVDITAFAASVEPREMKIADVTGDGKANLVTVIHDRIIIYPQD